MNQDNAGQAPVRRYTANIDKWPENVICTATVVMATDYDALSAQCAAHEQDVAAAQEELRLCQQNAIALQDQCAAHEATIREMRERERRIFGLPLPPAPGASNG
jgi:hypothetical protein